ncbi:MAG: hypothetical protein U1D30_07025 [Planctomycetota bacterium]
MPNAALASWIVSLTEYDPCSLRPYSTSPLMVTNVTPELVELVAELLSEESKT